VSDHRSGRRLRRPVRAQPSHAARRALSPACGRGGRGRGVHSRCLVFPLLSLPASGEVTLWHAPSHHEGRVNESGASDIGAHTPTRSDRAEAGHGGGEFANPLLVTIVGYQSHAMEPFISATAVTCCLIISTTQARHRSALGERMNATSFRYVARSKGSTPTRSEGVPTWIGRGCSISCRRAATKGNALDHLPAKFQAGRATVWSS